MNMNWVSTVQQLKDEATSFVLVTVIGVQGSTPRESGTKMVVTQDELYGTIGGGHLEYKSMQIARELLDKNEAIQHLEYFPLSASLGQCCGGSASVLFECFPATMPRVMLFGAGHVGKALATILAGLPCQVDWVDSRESEFPQSPGGNIAIKSREFPPDAVVDASPGLFYIVMTHNHQLDLELCEAILKREDFAYLGVIGSKSKAIRFRKKLLHRGFDQKQIDRITCPMGLTNVSGKKPMEVAVSIAGELIGLMQQTTAKKLTDGVNWRQVKQLIQQNS